MYDAALDVIAKRLEQAAKAFYWLGFADGALAGSLVVALLLLVVLVLRRLK